MIFIPLPFVIAILLLVLFLLVVRRENEANRNLPFLALILFGAVQSFLSGLRWGYDIESVKFIAPAVAAIGPPLAYSGVALLVRKNRLSTAQTIGLHALPALMILFFSILWRDLIDIALVLIFIGYGLAILFLMRPGTDALRLAPFEGAQNAYRAIIFAAIALFMTAALDVFVFLNFVLSRGADAVTAITMGNLGGLVMLSIAAASASRSHTPAPSRDEDKPFETVEDTKILGVLKTIMETRHIYRDPDLNLDRLARKTGITARQISTAINRATAKNVSQYVNEYRISEACELLAQIEKPVTTIMFDVGFQTKSNFNREFRRVTDMTPVQWREAHTHQA